MSLIEKEKLVKIAKKVLSVYDENKDAKTALEQLMWHIYDARSVDAVPVAHGRFIEPVWNPPEEYGDDYTCSVCGWSGTVCVCGKEQIGRKKVNYCPNCGAKMDGEDKL